VVCLAPELPDQSLSALSMPSCPTLLVARCFVSRHHTHSGGRTEPPKPPGQPQGAFFPGARHSRGKKLPRGVGGVAHQAQIDHCFPGVRRSGVTKNSLEGRLRHLGAVTCQSSAATAARKCLQVLPGVSSEAVVCTVLITAVEGMRLEEPPDQPEDVFFPCSGGKGREQSLG
jgi:hypothetical protein